MLRYLVFLHSMFGILVGLSATGALWAEELVVATDAGMRPFGFVDETGSPAGFDVDLIRELGARAGFSPRIMVQPFEGLITGLQQSQYDIVVGALSITPERQKEVLFSNAYFQSRQAIIIREGDGVIRPDSQLKGSTVAVQNASTGHEAATRMPGVNILAFDDVQQAFQALTTGTVDAVINDLANSSLFIESTPNSGLRIHSILPGVEEYGIAVNKSSIDLMKRLNLALTRMKADGTLQRIEERWLKPSQSRLASVGWSEFFYGIAATFFLFTTSATLSLFLGLFVATFAVADRRGVASLARCYIACFRGIPLLVLILWIYFGVAAQLANATGIRLPASASVIVAFALSYSAFVGEILRSAILSLGRAQWDASQILGLTRWQTLRHIVLPQALRKTFGPLAGEATALIKDTSLASIIAVPELMYQCKIQAGRDFTTFRTYSAAAAFYISMSLIISYMQRLLERSRHDT